MIPYGKQTIDDDDIAAMVAVLRSDFLTQGPAVESFERAFAAKVGAAHAVALNSGTAALHACMHALGIGPGDEVIVPPITFTATANCVRFVGATPVFADVTAEGHIDPEQIEQKIAKNTKAVIAVDYAGLPCNYARILEICRQADIPLVCDACHALGATWNDRPVGSIGRLNCFSFHPVKHIATGEGGMVTTDDPALAQRVRDFRNHGITRDPARFVGLTSPSLSTHQPINSSSWHERGPWYYEMHDLGYNYRMPDLNAALGESQLKKLDAFVARRRAIAARYYEELSGMPHLTLPMSDLHPTNRPPYCATHAYHLFPVRIDFSALKKTRTALMQSLRELGVGTQVHYIPVCRQPDYRRVLAEKAVDCPRADQFYSEELSIPIWPGMRDEHVETVIRAVRVAIEQGGG
jgi:perosamine synthetase